MSVAPFVRSPPEVVRKMLELAELRPGETVYDLGCGDGRITIIAAREFGARAVGVEIRGDLVKEARSRVHELGLEKDVKIVHGNLMDVDISPAAVVTLYLITSANEKVRPKLERELVRGARVVSHDYRIPGWDATSVVRCGTGRTLYLYRRP